MSWVFEVSEDELDNVWVVASWMATENANLRMAALATNLGTAQTYEWRWAADWRISGAGHWHKRRSPTTPRAPCREWGRCNWGGRPVRDAHRYRKPRRQNRTSPRYWGAPAGVLMVLVRGSAPGQ